MLKFLLFILLIASFSYAVIDVRNGVWFLHPHITGSVYLAENVLDIENLAKQKKWEEAANKAGELAIDGLARKSYLSNGEYMPMVLECMQTVYQSKDARDLKSIEKIIKPVLKKYKAFAADKRCYSYKYAQQALRSYYIKGKKQKEAFELFKECLRYDPYDDQQLMLFIKWGTLPENKILISKIIDFISYLQNEGCDISPEIFLYLIASYDFDCKDKTRLLSTWLHQNPHYNADVVCKCLDELCCVTNSYNIAELLKVRSLIIDTAIKQKNIEERLPVIAKAMLMRCFLEDYLYKSGIKLEKKSNKASVVFKKTQDEWNCFLRDINTNNFDISAIDEMLKYLWSSENRQRVGDKLSLFDTIEAIEIIDKFKRRIYDTSDQIYDCNKYRGILLLQGVPGNLYWKVENLFWRAEYEKAYRLFHFFLCIENQDEFVKGASCFYIGRMLYELRNDQLEYGVTSRKMDALKYLLAVPSFQTCFTYISYAYIMASEILYNFKCFDSATLLCMVDVPSVDYSSVKLRKHRNASNYSLAANSFTNYVKNIQECLRFCDDENAQKVRRFNMKKEIPQQLWDYCLKNPINDLDKAETLQKSLKEIEMLEDEDIAKQFYLAAVKQWPRNYDLPQNIATNRILNNNIFTSKKGNNL